MEESCEGPEVFGDYEKHGWMVAYPKRHTGPLFQDSYSSLLVGRAGNTCGRRCVLATAQEGQLEPAKANHQSARGSACRDRSSCPMASGSTPRTGVRARSSIPPGSGTSSLRSSPQRSGNSATVSSEGEAGATGLPDPAHSIRVPLKKAQPCGIGWPGCGTGGATTLPFTSLKVTLASPRK